MKLNRRMLLGSTTLAIASAMTASTARAAAPTRDATSSAGTDPGASKALAQYVAQTRFEDLPQDVIEMTKRAILDAIGVSIAAYSLEPACRPFHELAVESGVGSTQSTLIGSGKKTSMPLAALANGALAHALDYEDSHEASRTHPNAATIAAALATAEGLRDVSGKRLITAVALGCDVVCRLALAQIEAPGAAPTRAFYRPAILGTFGAVSAAASLLRLNTEQTLDAFSLALCQNSCSGEILNSPDSHIRAVREGPCAQAGVLSALLASKGVRGFELPFEGSHGYFAMYWGGARDDRALTSNLGKHFAGRDVAFKPWPSCRDTHLYIQAALELQSRANLDVASIARIEAPVAQRNLIVCEPAASKKAPRTAIDAKFSLYFTVASALLHRQINLASFTEAALQAAPVLECAAKVNYRLDPQAARPLDEGGAAVLEVTMRNGTVHRQSVARLAGSLSNPLSRADLIEKFIDCGLHAHEPRSRTELRNLSARILGLENATDISTIMAQL